MRTLSASSSEEITSCAATISNISSEEAFGSIKSHSPFIDDHGLKTFRRGGGESLNNTSSTIVKNNKRAATNDFEQMAQPLQGGSVYCHKEMSKDAIILRRIKEELQRRQLVAKRRGSVENKQTKSSSLPGQSEPPKATESVSVLSTSSVDESCVDGKATEETNHRETASTQASRSLKPTSDDCNSALVATTNRQKQASQERLATVFDCDVAVSVDRAGFERALTMLLIFATGVMIGFIVNRDDHRSF